MKKNILIISVILALLVGIIIGSFVNSLKETYGTNVSTKMKSEKKLLYWVDTMEPMIHYKGPGKSRMNMELKPVYAENNDTETTSHTIRISPTVVNNLGVRIAPVSQGTFAKHLNTVGYVQVNENRINNIHTYADGWVKKLFVKVAGEPVQQGQILLQLYSPMLINAQEEYLLALNSGDKQLINAAVKKLQTFKISAAQIQQIKKTHKTNLLINITSPQNGIIQSLNVREGSRVIPETEIMSLVDLSDIWIIAQVVEDKANWIKVGTPAEAKISTYPGKIWTGEVQFIYPEIDPTTRTLKIRFHFKNLGELLKPNMYANITLFASPKQNVTMIPLEALIRGHENNRVIVSLGKGRFQVRSVVTGIESENQVEILSGLTANEMVVTSGQFLIDSEANLKADLERLDTPMNARETPS